MPKKELKITTKKKAIVASKKKEPVKKAVKVNSKSIPVAASSKTISKKKVAEIPAPVIPKVVAPKKLSKNVPNGGLGKKTTCYSCNTKFYDFGREEKICPKCGVDQNVKPVVKVKVTRTPRVTEFDVVDEPVSPNANKYEDDLSLESDEESETTPEEEENES